MGQSNWKATVSVYPIELIITTYLPTVCIIFHYLLFFPFFIIASSLRFLWLLLRAIWG